MADITTGLNTQAQLDATPPHLRVTWISWDSPFRGTGLAVGDRIVAVNGQALPKPADLAQAQRITPSLPGQYAEHQGFESAGFKPGSPLALRIQRRAPEQGWTTLEVQAPLAERQRWRDANNNEVLGPGGPSLYASDDFNSGSWNAWYNERVQRTLALILDIEQRTSTFVSRVEAKALREAHGERVAFAARTYPGPWSRALKADYDAALAIASGRPVSLGPQALDFRKRGEQLSAQVRAAAQAAWNEAQARHATDTIPAFPALSPVRDDVRTLIGKVVALPPLANRDWITDGGHGWFAASGEGGWYFLDAEDEAAQAMLRAQARYMRLVNPKLPPQWRFLARITGQPRLTVVGERAHFGLVVEPLAVMVGDENLFVDLTTRQGDQAAFAGEAGLLDDTPDLPPDTASPKELMQALVAAVKTADLAVWRALHAQWSIERQQGEDGQAEQWVLYPFDRPPDESMFELSRRSLQERVLDAQVAWVGDAQTVLDAQRFPGAQMVEETEVWLDHVGDFSADNEGTRTFQDVTVSARWRLQRLNSGPWRVARAQPI